MKNKTDEFSFILKPSKYGIGVFAAHDIAKETYLRLFGTTENNENYRILRGKNISEDFKDYCMNRGNDFICPKDFGNMPVGWYLNHSKTPNAFHKDYDYYALRDIKKGEEILIDYNSLEEPEEAKDSYYKK